MTGSETSKNSPLVPAGTAVRPYHAPRLESGMRIMYENVPPEYLEKLNEWFRWRGIDSLTAGGRDVWASESVRGSPQSLIVGRHYPADNLTASRPRDPVTLTHERFHRHFHEKVKDTLKFNTTLEDALLEGTAFMVETALFGDQESANSILSNEKFYTANQARTYALLRNWFNMYGDYFLKSFVEHPSAVLKTILSNGSDWNVALQNIPSFISKTPDLANNVSRTTQGQLEDYLVDNFKVPLGIATAIVEDGQYANGVELMLDMSPSKVTRINAFYRIASALFFHAGYSLEDARNAAERRVLSSSYELTLRGLKDIETVVSQIAEIGDERVTDEVLQLLTVQVVEDPIAANTVRKNISSFKQLLGLFATSRKDTNLFLGDFAENPIFRSYLIDHGGLEIIDRFASAAGKVYTTRLLHEMREIGFGSAKGAYHDATDENQNKIFPYECIVASLRGNISQEHSADVFEILPKYLAAVLLSRHFFHIPDGERNVWSGFSAELLSQFDYLDAPSLNSSLTNFRGFFLRGFSDGSVPMFVQMYNYALQSAPERNSTWQQVLQEEVNKYASLVKNVVDLHTPQLYPQYTASLSR